MIINQIEDIPQKPLCALCNKVVNKITVYRDIFDRSDHWTVFCHGEIEKFSIACNRIESEQSKNKVPVFVFVESLKRRKILFRKFRKPKDEILYKKYKKGDVDDGKKTTERRKSSPINKNRSNK